MVFLKQTGQKSVKKEPLEQRKGPKRPEECQLKIPTYIREQDTGDYPKFCVNLQCGVE